MKSPEWSFRSEVDDFVRPLQAYVLAGGVMPALAAVERWADLAALSDHSGPRRAWWGTPGMKMSTLNLARICRDGFVSILIE